MFQSAQMVCLIFSLSVGLSLTAQEKVDISPHTIRMVEVDKGVSLEVLDWGGAGRPLVLLTGLADDAHIFDQFAPKLTARYHVYGISRRGRGASSTPEPNATNYSATRLGQDVLAVIDALHLKKPILVGHSIAGEELSYIGSRHPEAVAALVYLDAGYPYALYRASGELELDAIELRKQLSQFINGYAMEPVKNYDSLMANLKRVELEVTEQEEHTGSLPPTPISPRMTPDLFAIMDGRESFNTVYVPALVIFADGDNPMSGGDDVQSRASATRNALQRSDREQQIAAFQRQVPSAHVVRIAHADHYVFRSNESDVCAKSTRSSPRSLQRSSSQHWVTHTLSGSCLLSDYFSWKIWFR
jgi:non-heme chloroperoxidase